MSVQHRELKKVHNENLEPWKIQTENFVFSVSVTPSFCRSILKLNL